VVWTASTSPGLFLGPEVTCGIHCTSKNCTNILFQTSRETIREM
jgi:hypothetical protein